jgi:hypothetical protein
VVVEADAFKETDVIYRAISSMGHHNDMLQTAELVRTAHKTPLSLSPFNRHHCHYYTAFNSDPFVRVYLQIARVSSSHVL